MSESDSTHILNLLEAGCIAVEKHKKFHTPIIEVLGRAGLDSKNALAALRIQQIEKIAKNPWLADYFAQDTD